MTSNLVWALILLAVLGSGIIGGVFFAFSSFVMAALGRVAPDQGIASMQAINVTVINPAFMLAFMGTTALAAVLIVVALLRWDEPGGGALLMAGLLYLAGCFGVTMNFNVPLNDQLAAVTPGTAEASRIWTQYLSDWTRWNHVRTIASLAAMLAYVTALNA